MAGPARAVAVGALIPAPGAGVAPPALRLAAMIAIAALLAALGATWFAVGAGMDYPEPSTQVVG